MTPLRAAMREASLMHPVSALMVLFLAPPAVVRYLSLLAVDAGSRVASDAAYFFGLVAVHALAVQIGVAVHPVAAGYSDVMRVRGPRRARWIGIRSAGFLIRGLAPKSCVVAGCVMGAWLGGAGDASRTAVAATGSLETFGLAVLLASCLPRASAAICASAIVIIGHIPAATGGLAPIFPQYHMFDLWPGTVLTAPDIAELVIRALLYMTGAIIVASCIADWRDR